MQILNLFKEFDLDSQHKYLESTIAKDNTKSQEEALLEVYRKMRPGEPAVLENAQSFYLSVPLNREKILCKLRNLIFQNKTYFEDSDYLYIICRFFNTEDKKDIILGHEIIKEQDKIWADIINLHKIELTTI